MAFPAAADTGPREARGNYEAKVHTWRKLALFPRTIPCSVLNGHHRRQYMYYQWTASLVGRISVTEEHYQTLILMVFLCQDKEQRTLKELLVTTLKHQCQKQPHSGQVIVSQLWADYPQLYSIKKHG